MILNFRDSYPFNMIKDVFYLDGYSVLIIINMASQKGMKKRVKLI